MEHDEPDFPHIFSLDAEDGEYLSHLLAGHIQTISTWGDPIAAICLTFNDGRQVLIGGDGTPLVFGEEHTTTH